MDVYTSAGGHPELPAGSPLQACPHCEALIDITEKEPLEVITCPDCGRNFAVSGLVGPYNIIEVAGKGGMGVVYRAYDPSLDRDIALKLLRKDHSADTKLIEQLETEAAITASINDPNVVRIFGTGRDRERFYIAMELVNKGSLDDLIRLQSRVAETQVLQVGIQIASGLRAAWQHGMIHRDVKPGNILFADANTAKIVDFGLAIFMDQEESVRGEVWGTPYYVAPEKLDQEPEDFRSDMYSLGATLFHALAGRPPFEAESATLVALKHLKSQAVSLQAFAPWVSNSTAHIINRTLAKNPANRYQSYDELIHNFEYALEELHKQGGTNQPRTRVVLETEEDRKTWTWVVLGMVAVMVALVGVFVMMRPNGRTDVVAVKATPSTATARTGAGIAALESQLNALVKRDANAAAQFAQLLAGGNVPEQDRAWVAYLEGTADLAASRPVEARAAFAKVPALAEPITDTPVRKFLQDSATRLTRPDPITTAEVAALNHSSHEALALFAFGLHNWAAGLMDEGAALLRQFRSTQPNSNYPWFNTLKPLVTSAVADLGQIKALEARFKKAATPAERADLALEVRNLTGAAATYGKSLIAPYTKEVEAYLTEANKAPTEGVYRIFNKRSGMVLDVDGYNRKNRAGLNQYFNNRHANQEWDLVRQANGFFLLRAVQGDTMLDVNNSNQDEGGVVQMWEPNGTNAELWKIELHGDGYFKIRSKVSNKLLTVKDQSAAEGAKLEQRSDSNDASQLWRFQRDGKSLAKGWSLLSLGEPDAADGGEVTKEAIIITSKGADVWNTRDDATFVARGAGPDFDFVARIASVTGSSKAKAGLMIRVSLHNDQPNVAVVYTGERVVTQRRAEVGETAVVNTRPPESAPSGGGSPVPVGDADFETVVVGSGHPDAYKYGPAGTAWTFSEKRTSVGTGIAGNKSGFTLTNANAPKGAQVAFVQSTGWMSQSIRSTVAGPWKVIVSAAQRARQKQTKNQVIRVLVDNQEIGRITPADTSYSDYMVRSSASIPAGAHVLRFEGVNATDDSAFIDDVRVTVDTPGGAATAKPAVVANGLPWLKLERRGNKVTTYQSNDGRDWTVSAATDLSMHSSVFVGFVVCSRNSGQSATVKFDNVSFTQR